MDEFQKAVQDLKFWQEGQHFFTCELYSLMQKADVENLRKIEKGFPVHVRAYIDWYNSPDPDDFFEKVLGNS